MTKTYVGPRLRLSGFGRDEERMNYMERILGGKAREENGKIILHKGDTVTWKYTEEEFAELLKAAEKMKEEER